MKKLYVKPTLIGLLFCSKTKKITKTNDTTPFIWVVGKKARTYFISSKLEKHFTRRIHTKKVKINLPQRSLVKLLLR